MSSDKEDGEIEDGEIESDEEEISISQTEISKITNSSLNIPPLLPELATIKTKQQPKIKQLDKGSSVLNDDDDWATNVQNAIAKALKKDGVEPPLPNIATKPGLEEPTPLPRSKRRKKPKSERKRNKKQREDENKMKEQSQNPQTQEQTVAANSQQQQPQATALTVVDLMEVDVDEYEMLGMRGGSPPPQATTVAETVMDSDESSRSYDSEEFNKSNSSPRGNFGGDRRKRQRDRSRNRNNDSSNKNKRQRTDRRDRERERERERDRDKDRERDRSDEERREPRKMEICKFYLLDCCAKRNNCSYLHSEFPCKYYYLGMECPHKDCKFNHGKPLTAEFRGILLKHLETAPKEILGDFPRMQREKALKHMDAAHLNLLRAARGEPPLESTIPSLLDGIEPKKKSDSSSKTKRSRWCDNVPPAPELPADDAKCKQDAAAASLSIKKLNDVLTVKQIDDLIAMKIENIEQIKQLTLLQMTDLGLTITQISEIQMKALNMQKEMEIVETVHEQQKDLDLRIPEVMPAQQSEDTDLREKDVDLRILRPSSNTTTSSSTLGSVPITAALKQLDQATAKNSNNNDAPSYANFQLSSVVDYSQYLRDSQIPDDEPKDLKIDEPSQEDENELQIDESWNDGENDGSDSSDSENEKRRDMPFDQPKSDLIMSPIHTQESLIATLKEMERARKASSSLVPPSYSSSSSEVIFESFYDRKNQESLASRLAELGKKVVNDEKPRRPSINEIKSPSDGAPSEDETPIRPSIYDVNFDDDDDDAQKLETKIDAKINKGDRDMRLTSIIMDPQESSSGDIDLRLPFKPMMAHYIPATEIDASIMSHLPIEYKLYECDVPKPDFNELRRNKHASSGDSISDPRLRRLLGIRGSTKKAKEELAMPPQIASPDPIPVVKQSSSSSHNISSSSSSHHVSSPTRTATTVAASSPRIDPRDPRRRREETLAAPTPVPFSTREANQLDTQQLLVLLQKSPWYQELSSNNKILVNQHLATLSGELKRFHATESLVNGDRVFDVSIVTSNPFLSIILTNLGVFLNENGYFTLVEDSKESSKQHHPQQQQQQQPPAGVPNLASMMSTPPPNLLAAANLPVDLSILNSLRPLLNAAAAASNPNPFNIRPGILSMPPPLVSNPQLLSETLMRNGLFPNNFQPQPLLGGNMMGNRINDNFRSNDNNSRQQDRRNNWNNQNSRNNRHNNQRNRRN